jgi:hypothetical protein
VNADIASGKKNRVEKGHEIGMFYFGGLFYCVLFQIRAKLHWIGAAAAQSDQSHSLAINSALAHVSS